jgi:hypothetical protein
MTDEQRRRVLDNQKARRARLFRIDYYPSDEAMRVIEAETLAGYDYSTAISRIIEKYASGNRAN